MALFGTATERILRTRWRTLQKFAEELYALLNGDVPLTTDAPVTITMPKGSTTSGLTVNMPAGSDGGITVKIGDQTFTFPSPAGGTTGGDTGGGVQLGNIDWSDSSDQNFSDAVPDPQDNPFVLYGVVGGKVGGNVYSTEVWGKNPQTAPRLGVLPVRYGMVDPEDTIPAGTIVPVLCYPGPDPQTKKRVILDAEGFVPVWLREGD